MIVLLCAVAIGQIQPSGHTQDVLDLRERYQKTQNTYNKLRDTFEKYEEWKVAQIAGHPVDSPQRERCKVTLESLRLWYLQALPVAGQRVEKMRLKYERAAAVRSRYEQAAGRMAEYWA